MENYKGKGQPARTAHLKLLNDTKQFKRYAAEPIILLSDNS
jgi:hypothetical protein